MQVCADNKKFAEEQQQPQDSGIKNAPLPQHRKKHWSSVGTIFFRQWSFSRHRKGNAINGYLKGFLF